MAEHEKSVVQLERVRVVRAVSFGVFCIVNEKVAEIFVPFAQIYEPPVTHLRAGAIVEMTVPVWFARDHKLV